MDWESLKTIKEALDDVFADGYPTAADLDNEDYHYIELYDHLISAYEIFDEMGF